MLVLKSPKASMIRVRIRKGPGQTHRSTRMMRNPNPLRKEERSLIIKIRNFKTRNLLNFITVRNRVTCQRIDVQ